MSTLNQQGISIVRFKRRMNTASVRDLKVEACQILADVGGLAVRHLASSSQI